MDSLVPLFLEITSTDDVGVAQSFLEMAGGDLDTAVTLYFEHGTGVGPSRPGDDAEVAGRLQQEMYAEPESADEGVRRPLEPVHDQLVSDYTAVDPHRGMFGRTQVGIFNQLDDGDDEDGVEVVDLDDEDGDDDEFQMLDDDDDSIRQQNNRRARRRREFRTSTQRRLANIFRPPWDIIQKLDLDGAKVVARQEKKWILVNIQDMTDFRCQCLNRDFWSNTEIKEIVRENFIFLQYHHDSPNGEYYINMYPFSEYPHIAILDPMTGERLKMWSGVPNFHVWVEQVVDFMDRFSLDKNKKNPIVQHSVRPDVSSLSEEQQIKMAMEHSLNPDAARQQDSVDIVDLDNGEGTKERPLELESDEPVIEAVDVPDPEGTDVTRIQIRSGDGRRVVKKFALQDPVLRVFQFVKYYFGIDNKPFHLTMQRENLIDKLDQTVQQCGLRNASLLLEVEE
ncbi:hypothetical protein KL918_000110 [Ogataea parapolymorpha]|uniref:UBX (Ubiquitin regulatory X) domain-containing protein n=1 Tax=Ogataea parapolymorpha (strain ATCC 26012 / BCRC 20466 / JCM 22074 / NRRL Y-7560 / DL-1) TaxID=871575 RepID=W1Q833_OGAPD|nr:UBX (ubiquitin regulatory X) domain-containing protein [Ogataea parapolymorpha DL-1]ESW96162.1 UBX (ubiquitin regulatory X) domain-containing protein [Ogataea parapolymorpha DL-1]KAG7869906.1 hypothetical protein KL918_000110 [Ogataea parapolymorpha]KAG7873194.1 hypothetical protein KL916_002495 [Ogataea parapolymorpha]